MFIGRVKIGWGRSIVLPLNLILNGFKLELIKSMDNLILNGKPSLLVSTPLSSTIPVDNREEYRAVLTRMKLERDTWDRKFHALDIEKEELKKQLKEEDDILFLQDG